MAFKLLSKQTTAERVSLHPVSLMRLVDEGKFPRPIKIGDPIHGRVRFVEADVMAWLEERLALRDEGAGEPSAA